MNRSITKQMLFGARHSRVVDKQIKFSFEC
jgi:hypothetical protein